MAKRKPHRADTGTGADKQRVPPKQPGYVTLLGEHGGRSTPATPATTMVPHQRFGDRGADPDDAPLTRLVRYSDLARSGIVRNRTQLENSCARKACRPAACFRRRQGFGRSPSLKIGWRGARSPASAIGKTPTRSRRGDGDEQRLSARARKLLGDHTASRRPELRPIPGRRSQPLARPHRHRDQLGH